MTDVAQQKLTQLLLLAFLVVLLVFSMTALTIFIQQPKIESDLAQRANRLLAVSGLFKGSVSFDGRDAVVKGSVRSEKDIADVIKIVENVDGVRLVKNELAVRPQEVANVDTSVKTIEKPEELKGRFTLRYDSGKWTLIGEVDTEKTRESLVNSTTEVIGSEIINALTINPDSTSQRWVDKYLHVLEKFAYVHGGAELTLDKGILTIGGEVDSQAEMRMALLPLQQVFGEVAQIRNRLRIPKYNGGLYVPQKNHPIEQIDLSDVTFNKENTEIQSYTSIDKVIDLLKQDPETNIELAGHVSTSASDDEDKNVQHSLDQALLVKRYLVDNGIAKSRLRTNGYGSSRPIDEDDESRNQRIEITVLR